jgi:hypothetical protein
LAFKMFAADLVGIGEREDFTFSIKEKVVEQFAITASAPTCCPGPVRTEGFGFHADITGSASLENRLGEAAIPLRYLGDGRRGADVPGLKLIAVVENAAEVFQEGEKISGESMFILSTVGEFGEDFVNLGDQIESYALVEKGRNIFHFDESGAN